MSIIVPTITAEEPHTYRAQIERVQKFATRLHIDLMDGIFTPNKSIATNQVWWPETVSADIHLMFRSPESELDALFTLKPAMVIIPAESDCDIAEFAQQLNKAGIKCGLAILAETSVASVAEVLGSVQQLLIFSGNLGHQGGSAANLGLLEKAVEAKSINPALEIAWDGGVNEANAAHIAHAGVAVINVGSAIQLAEDSEQAFNKLQALVSSS